MTSAEELAVHTLLDDAGVPFGTLRERVAALVADRDRLQAELAERSRRGPRDALLAQLDERREDVLLMLADACLDEADWREGAGQQGVAAHLRAEAKGWGWLGAARKWPTQMRDGDWLWDRPDGDPCLYSDQLAVTPEMLPGNRRFPTCRAALEWVVGLIARGEWDPTPKRRSMPEDGEDG